MKLNDSDAFVMIIDLITETNGNAKLIDGVSTIEGNSIKDPFLQSKEYCICRSYNNIIYLEK